MSTVLVDFQLFRCPGCGHEHVRPRSRRWVLPCRCGERMEAFELVRGDRIDTVGVTAGSGLAWIGTPPPADLAKRAAIVATYTPAEASA